MVLSQVKREYEAYEVIKLAYLSEGKGKSHTFKKLEIEHVPKSKNQQADALSKLAISSTKWSSKEQSMGNFALRNN